MGQSLVKKVAERCKDLAWNISLSFLSYLASLLDKNLYSVPIQKNAAAQYRIVRIIWSLLISCLTSIELRFRSSKFRGERCIMLPILKLFIQSSEDFTPSIFLIDSFYLVSDKILSISSEVPKEILILFLCPNLSLKKSALSKIDFYATSSKSWTIWKR